MPRTCVFCGGTPVTAEHLWPDWLRRRESLRESRLHVQVTQHLAQESERREWTDHPFKMRAKAVCATCNTGWMSDLEQATIVLLDGMIDGRGRALHQTGQRTLAAWALKGAMMFDQGAPAEARTIPSAHYSELLETGEPPVGARVWIGAYDETQLGVSNVIAAEVTALGQTDPDHRNVYVRTFTIGPVAFQVFGTTNPALFGLAYDWPESNVHLIWPFEKSITWMPRPAMTDITLAEFGQRIVGGLARQAQVVEP